MPVRFSVGRLKGKRTFVFARAGYGKSNLIKYLVSQLYCSPPDVGLLIFDPEGEYALPDAHGRPGLVNVPALQNRVSLYTNRKVEPAQAGVVRGEVFVDFGDFPPQDIVAAFVPPEKQDTVFANLLRSLDWKLWKQLVELLAADGFGSDDRKIGALLSYKAREADVSIAAIKNNLVPPIRRLHRAGATLGKNILEELRLNRVVIVDVSLLGSEDSLATTGMLMRRIFQHNVRHLTDLAGPTVRCVAVLEEAQTFLGERTFDERNVFVRWIKEGRKYGLGAILGHATTRFDRESNHQSGRQLFRPPPAQRKRPANPQAPQRLLQRRNPEFHSWRTHSRQLLFLERAKPAVRAASSGPQF